MECSSQTALTFVNERSLGNFYRTRNGQQAWSLRRGDRFKSDKLSLFYDFWRAENFTLEEKISRDYSIVGYCNYTLPLQRIEPFNSASHFESPKFIYT
jgi:hypothetical protein